jgi:hypothetical protein
MEKFSSITFATTSAPNVNETPRSFSPQPWVSLSGSDLSIVIKTIKKNVRNYIP